MRAIQLNYTPSAMASVTGSALLLAACLCAGMLWQYADTLQQQTTTMQQAIVQAKRAAGIEQLPSARQPATAANIADMQQAQQVAAFLLLPWNELFNALEAAAMDDVVLLSIEPDAKKKQLSIIAEAKNKELLFRYIQRLEATPQLSKVYMLKHELLQDIAQQPIRFVVTANWTKAP